MIQQPIVTPLQFFNAWCEVCSNSGRQKSLRELWSSRKEYTKEILGKRGDVLEEVASRLNLQVYAEYYRIDAIFFLETDRVYCSPKGQTWVQNIRIAFEHEHDFSIGLFVEISHLLITRAELRVLVTYPENEENLHLQLRNLECIVKRSGISENPALLIIVGQKNHQGDGIKWRPFVFKDSAFMPLGLASSPG